MPLSDPAEILLLHDRWATQQLFRALEGLSHEQFHQKFEMGPGSLHATLTHMIAAMRAWTEVLESKPMQPRIDQDGKERTAAELAALFEQGSEDFVRATALHPLENVVSRERGGKVYTFTAGAVLTHVTTHQMHHRAQCLNMLRHLGVKPLPPSSVMEWTLMGETPTTA